MKLSCCISFWMKVCCDKWLTVLIWTFNLWYITWTFNFKRSHSEVAWGNYMLITEGTFEPRITTCFSIHWKMTYDFRKFCVITTFLLIMDSYEKLPISTWSIFKINIYLSPSWRGGPFCSLVLAKTTTGDWHCIFPC